MKRHIAMLLVVLLSTAACTAGSTADYPEAETPDPSLLEVYSEMIPPMPKRRWHIHDPTQLVRLGGYCTMGSTTCLSIGTLAVLASVRRMKFTWGVPNSQLAPMSIRRVLICAQAEEHYLSRPRTNTSAPVMRRFQNWMMGGFCFRSTITTTRIAAGHGLVCES